MAYVIEFCDEKNEFVMEGVYELLIGAHLWAIARKEGLESEAYLALSESHLLHILQSCGVDIKLINCDW